MSPSTSDDIETAAVDAIGKVVAVNACERLNPTGQGPTPDWRLTLSDGRVADVEVTTCPDPDELGLFAAAHNPDGSPKEWPDERLSYRWMIRVHDLDPAGNKKRRPLKKVAEDAATICLKQRTQAEPPPRWRRTRRLLSPVALLPLDTPKRNCSC